jgi:hypothetical protein
MKKISACFLGMTALVATAALAQTPAEPGASRGVELVNISKNNSNTTSALPTVVVSPVNDNLVAFAWRRYGLPIDTNALKGVRVADCHVSVSTDGGKTFKDTDLMPKLRNEGAPGVPSMWYCNLPWATIAADGTIYAGGSTFTAGGVVQKEPKQGRAQVSVSTDGGKTWSKGVWAVSLDRVGPGVKSLKDGAKPEDTPWDGSKGFVDAKTGTLYVTTGGGVVASTDKGKTFGNYYRAVAMGFTNSGRGGGAPAPATARDLVASHGILAGAVSASAGPAGTKCPCLVFISSRDNGAKFATKLVLNADQFSAEGRTHYPEIAADPAHEGHFAIVTFTPDHKSVQVSYTSDAGATWKTAKVRDVPKGVQTVSSADQPGIGYTSDGQLLVAWRGQRNVGVYNIYAALLNGNAFGPTIKLNPEPSIYPALTYVGNYNPTSGGGDFYSSITGNHTTAFIGFPYAPKGVVQDDWLARVPLAAMK